MAKCSLTDRLMSFLPDCSGVTRVRSSAMGPGNGKRRVKIVRNDKDVVLTVVEPDHPRHRIVADTTDASATVSRVEQYLRSEKIDCMR